MRVFVRLFYLIVLGTLFVPIFGQVFPTNAIGYLNVIIAPGFNLISNPLVDSRGYTVADLAESLNGPVPDGLSVYLMHPDGYHSATYDASSQTFEPAVVAAELLSRGRGFFLFNPASNNLTFTFWGRITESVLPFTNDLPSGFSIVASMLPAAGTLEVQRFPAEPGDIVYRFNAVTQTFIISTFDDLEGAWLPAAPRIDVGEAFVVFKTRPAVWTQILAPPP